MVANILIAIGFFFTGAFIGGAIVMNEYKKQLKKLKGSGDKYILMYEL